MNQKFLVVFSVILLLGVGTVVANSNIVDFLSLKNLRLESNGAVPVNIQDQTTQIIDLHAHQDISNLTLIDDTIIGSMNIIIEHDVTIAVGQIIHFEENKRASQSEIVSILIDTPIAGQDTINLDTPMDYAYTTLSGIHNGNINLNVNGAITSQTFHISPPKDTKWDIVRMVLIIEDNSAMDSGKFGGITELTNGVVFRKKDGTYYNIFNAKSNSDFAVHAYDIAYDDRAPAGIYGFRARRTFGGQSKNGVVIRLDGNAGDQFQGIIQDDLTGLTKFHLIVQGHVVTD